MSLQLLRRAWDTLDTFRQAYPENWHEEDEQLMKDLIKADNVLSGVKLKWVGLTDEERNKLWRGVIKWGDPSHDDEDLMKALEAKLKEKNT